MIKKPISDLPELEKEILRFHTVAIHSITIGLSTDITFPNTHPTDIKNAISNLVQYGYFRDIQHHAVVFTDDGYYQCQIYFKYPLKRKRILNTIKKPYNFIQRHFVKFLIPIITGIIVYLITHLVLDKYILKHPQKDTLQTQQQPQQRLKSQEAGSAQTHSPKQTPFKPK